MNGKKKSNKREDEKKNMLNRNPHHRSIATTHSCRHASSLSACRYTQTLKLSFYVFYYSERQTANLYLCVSGKKWYAPCVEFGIGVCERFFGCAKIALVADVVFVIGRQPSFRCFNGMAAKEIYMGSLRLAREAILHRMEFCHFKTIKECFSVVLKSKLRLIATRCYLLGFWFIWKEGKTSRLLAFIIQTLFRIWN